MKRTVFVTIISVVFVLLMAGFVKNDAEWCKLHRTVEGLQTKIAQAHLIGKSPAEVMAFLDTEKIGHSDYITGKAAQQEAEITGQNEENSIGATINTDAHTFSFEQGFLDWDVKIHFQFDRENRLKSFEFWQRATGF